jgi:hypothetical protein
VIAGYLKSKSKKKPFFVTLTLIENAGFALRRNKQVGFAEINKLAPHLSMKPKASSKKEFDFNIIYGQSGSQKKVKKPVSGRIF